MNKTKIGIGALGLGLLVAAYLTVRPSCADGDAWQDAMAELVAQNKQLVKHNEQLKQNNFNLLNRKYELLVELEKQESQWIRKVPLDVKQQKYLFELSRNHGFEYDLLLGVIYKESTFKQTAMNINTNKTRDYGLFQINSNNLRWVDEMAGRKLDVINNPYDNMLAGVLELKYCRNYWEKQGLTGEHLIRATLLSYNRGITGWKRTGQQTHMYYDNTILEKAQEFKSSAA